MSKTSITTTAAALLIKPAMILGGLALINHAAGWAGLEPQFVESAADSLSEVTGLPHGDCAALVIVVGVLALYR